MKMKKELNEKRKNFNVFMLSRLMWYLSGGILVVPVRRRLSPWPGYPFIKFLYCRDGVWRCYQLKTLQQNNLPLMYASKHGFETLKSAGGGVEGAAAIQVEQGAADVEARWGTADV